MEHTEIETIDKTPENGRCSTLIVTDQCPEEVDNVYIQLLDGGRDSTLSSFGYSQIGNTYDSVIRKYYGRASVRRPHKTSRSHSLKQKPVVPRESSCEGFSYPHQNSIVRFQLNTQNDTNNAISNYEENEDSDIPQEPLYTSIQWSDQRDLDSDGYESVCFLLNGDRLSDFFSKDCKKCDQPIRGHESIPSFCLKRAPSPCPMASKSEAETQYSFVNGSFKDSEGKDSCEPSPSYNFIDSSFSLESLENQDQNIMTPLDFNCDRNNEYRIPSANCSTSDAGLQNEESSYLSASSVQTSHFQAHSHCNLKVKRAVKPTDPFPTISKLPSMIAPEAILQTTNNSFKEPCPPKVIKVLVDANIGKAAPICQKKGLAKKASHNNHVAANGFKNHIVPNCTDHRVNHVSVYRNVIQRNKCFILCYLLSVIFFALAGGYLGYYLNCTYNKSTDPVSSGPGESNQHASEMVTNRVLISQWCDHLVDKSKASLFYNEKSNDPFLLVDDSDVPIYRCYDQQ